MNFLINNHNATQKVKILEGLTELLTDIAREVLRSQPKEIYPFIADYIESMLLTRDHTFIAAKTIESLIDCSMNVVDCMQVIGIDVDRAKQAASVIQNNFIRHLRMIHTSGDCTFSSIRDLNTIEELLNCGIIKYSEAKLCLNIIYTAFKSFYHQQANVNKVMKTNNSQKWLECIENTLKIYRMSKPSREKIEQAAVTVQAAYKGYYVRRYKHCLAELRKLSDKIIFEGKLPKEIIHTKIIKPNLDDILSSIMQEIKEKSENEYIIESNLQNILDWALRTLNEEFEYNKTDFGLDIEEKRIEKNHKEFAAQIIQRAFRNYLWKKKSKKDLTIVSSIPDSDVSKFERDQEIEVQTETLSQKMRNVNFAVPPAPSPSIENLFDE